MLEGHPQNIVLTGKLNPVTGQMEYEQTPIVVASFIATEWRGSTGLPTPLHYQESAMFTPYPSHTTDLAASIYSPCSIVGCPNHANPVNAVEANLNVFGEPAVRVHLCDDHYKLFGDTDTGEHEIVAENEKPDIVIEGQ